MIRAAEIGSKGSARRSIAVVCRDPQTAKRTGQEREVLKIGSLEAVCPGAPGIKWLTDSTGDRGRTSRSTKGAGSDCSCMRNHGACQVLVKVPSRNDPKRAQVMLE